MQSRGPEVIYQHPLAYLVGLVGLALLRGFAGEDDARATWTRLADLSRLLDLADELGPGVEVAAISTEEGYRRWAPSYDAARNQLIDIEQPLVRRILADLPVGTAVDAACGTGRHAGFLVDLGHQVTGVDSSPDRLAVARTKVPGAQFAEGTLDRLPVPNASTDLLVCALALTHVPDLAPVMAEFARVLRPGGHLVISDGRSLVEGIARPLPGRDTEGRPVLMPWYKHRTSDYLAAALPVGLQVRDCCEPRRPTPLVRADGSSVTDPPGPPARHQPGQAPNMWALHAYAVDATNAAYRNTPAAIIWHFQLQPDHQATAATEGPGHGR